MTSLVEYTAALATHLTDDQLLCELRCAERCAMLSTRTRRDLALLKMRCLKREAERRGLAVGGQPALSGERAR